MCCRPGLVERGCLIWEVRIDRRSGRMPRPYTILFVVYVRFLKIKTPLENDPESASPTAAAASPSPSQQYWPPVHLHHWQLLSTLLPIVSSAHRTSRRRSSRSPTTLVLSILPLQEGSRFARRSPLSSRSWLGVSSPGTARGLVVLREGMLWICR